MKVIRKAIKIRNFTVQRLYGASCIVIMCIMSPLVFFGQESESPLMRFGIIADVQYADRDDAGSRNYRGSVGKLAEAVQMFNDRQVDFVVNLGDFIDTGAMSFDTLLSITEELDMPLYHVLGNHDFTASAKPDQHTLAKLGMEKRYYSKQFANWRFIVLDGNDVSLYGNPVGSPAYEEALSQLATLKDEGRPNAVEWNGGVGDKQLRWFARELERAERRQQKCIVLCHFPVHTGDGHQLWNADDVLAVLGQSSAVVAYFNGHVHHSQYAYREGVHFITFAGIVEQGGNAFAIASVYSDRIELVGFGKEESRVIR